MNTFDGNVFSEPDLMPASSYPLLGAVDHESFCAKKLIDMGLDKEWKVEVATDRTIQLDFDIPFDGPLPQQFSEALEIFSRMLKLPPNAYSMRTLSAVTPTYKTASWRKLKSRSGRTHVVISISWDMPQAERIAWQAAFGSDFRREALSLTYAALGQTSPVLLYSLKEEASLVFPILWHYTPALARV